jgi:hypothetical protein
MRRDSARLPKVPKPMLAVEILEARVPVSEQIGTALAISTLYNAGAAYVRSALPPDLASPPRPATADSLPGGILSPAWAPRGVTAAGQLVLVPAAAPPSQGVPNPPGVQGTFAADPGSEPKGFDGLTQDSAHLGSAPAGLRHPAAPATSTDTAGGSLVASPPGTTLVAPSSSAPEATNRAGDRSGTPDYLAPAPGSTPLGSLPAPPQSSATSSSKQTGPTDAPASGLRPEAPLLPGPRGTGPGGPGGGGSGGPGKKGRDPLWIRDSNNCLVLTPGVIEHDFATYAVDLRAQVSGATVQTYSWDVSQAPDATSVTGQATYWLHLTWRSFTGAARTNQITLTTTNVGGGGLSQTLTFSVIATDSPAWSSTPPTSVCTWPTVLPPDALTAQQETVDSQYYRLGLATGEVQTSHTLPAYNPGVAPLTLLYRSTAADRLPSSSNIINSIRIRARRLPSPPN